MSIPSLTYRNNLLINAPKIHTDLLWDLSFLFVGLTVIYFIAVFFYRNRISKNAEKVKQRKRELSPMISEFLFLEEDATKDEKSNYIHLKIEIRQLLKNTFNRKVLSEILLDLRKDIAGDAQTSLFKLYQDLGLHKDAFAKLKSWRWEVVSKGILELTQMKVDESYSFITKFINDKRSTIRKQAEIATVTLRHEGINYFLDTTKYKISEWQQLKLLDVIRNKDDFEPPRFKAWLTSNNKHVVLFALRLIKYYNQNDAGASLIELVKHKNSQIKEEAVACIKEFHVIDALETLKTVFWKSKVDVKIAILDAIGDLGSEEDIEFLKLIDKKEANFAVRSKAISSINAIAPGSIMPSKGILDTSGYKIPKDIPRVKKEKEDHIELFDEITAYEDEVETAELPVDLEATTEPFSNLEAIEKEDEFLVETADFKAVDEDVVDNQVEQIILDQEVESENIFEEPQYQVSISILEMEVEFEEIAMDTGILHLPVDYEEVYQNNDTNTIEEEYVNIDFLPLVVEGIEEVVSRYTFDANNDTTPIDLLQIKTISEEVGHETTDVIKENTSIEHSNKDVEVSMEELQFLPIVVENEYEEIDLENIDVDFEDVIPLEEIEITFEEIPFEEPSSDSYLQLPVIDASWVAPVTVASDDTSNKESYERYKIPEILQANVLFEIIPAHTDKQEDDDTSSSEVHENITISVEEEEQLSEMINTLLDFEFAEIPEENEGTSFDLTKFDFDESMQEETIIEIPKASIPKAIFGDIEFEASTRQLLNDLEEMGDEREIPLLRELLDHSKYEPYQERINSLINKLSIGSVPETQEEELKPFSVFQDLFRTCDTEAKLILLNEVVAVGDEKDLDFLQSLLDDESNLIRQKAKTVLAALNDRLEKKVTSSASMDFQNLIEEFEIRPSEPVDIFNVGFESSEVLNDHKETAHKTYGSFFGQICSFSHKILDRFNG